MYVRMDHVTITKYWNVTLFFGVNTLKTYTNTIDINTQQPTYEFTYHSILDMLDVRVMSLNETLFEPLWSKYLSI